MSGDGSQVSDSFRTVDLPVPEGSGAGVLGSRLRLALPLNSLFYCAWVSQNVANNCLYELNRTRGAAEAGR
jgi:hypothetical protein